jgi:hypothetical protein
VRKRKSFREATKAIRHAEDTFRALDSGKGDPLALSGAELESYRLAKRTLSAAEGDSPIHAAIYEYVAAKKLLEGRPLLSTIEKYVADARSETLKPITVTALVEEFIAGKTADGVSERYLQDCRSRLGRFARDFKTNVACVKTADVDA